MSLKLEDSTFTRNSAAYDYNFSVCGINEPRFVPGKFGNGLLIEEGTTNLIQNPYAQNDLTYWSVSLGAGSTGTRIRITDDGVIGNTCVEFTRTYLAAGGWIVFGQQFATYATAPYFNTAQIYTLSFWAKSVTGSNHLTVAIRDGDATDIVLNSTTLTLTTSWQRYAITFTPLLAGDQPIIYMTTDADNTTFRITGMQLEQKRYATSFTDSARSSETLDIPLSHLNPGMWTIEMWIKQTLTSPIVFSHGGRLLDLGGFWLWNFSPSWTDTSNRRIIADFGNDANGTRQYLDLNGTAFSTTTFEHLAVTFDGVTFKFYRNGTLWNSKTPALINAFTKIQLASACWIIDDLRISNIVRTSFDLSMALVDSNTTYKLDFDNKTRIYPTRIESNEFVEGDGPYFTYDGLHWQDIEEYINPLHIDNTIWCNEIIENSTLQSNNAHIQCGEIIENQALGFNGNIITCGEWIEHMDIDGEEISWLSQTEVQTREILRAHEIEEC